MGLFWDHCCFSFFINDIDKGIVSKLLKFADDTKLVVTVSSEAELEQLRTDLKRLYIWSIDWQMLFNTDKCKVGNRTFRPLDVLPLHWTFRHQDVSPPGRFAPRTFRPWTFATWTFRPWTFRPLTCQLADSQLTDKTTR